MPGRKRVRGKFPNGKLIDSLRRRRGWTLAEFAEETGLGESTISRIVSGRGRRDESTFQLIARKLYCEDYRELMLDDEEPIPRTSRLTPVKEGMLEQRIANAIAALTEVQERALKIVDRLERIVAEYQEAKSSTGFAVGNTRGKPMLLGESPTFLLVASISLARECSFREAYSEAYRHIEGTRYNEELDDWDEGNALSLVYLFGVRLSKAERSRLHLEIALYSALRWVSIQEYFYVREYMLDAVRWHRSRIYSSRYNLKKLLYGSEKITALEEAVWSQGELRPTRDEFFRSVCGRVKGNISWGVVVGKAGFDPLTASFSEWYYFAKTELAEVELINKRWSAGMRGVLRSATARLTPQRFSRKTQVADQRVADLNRLLSYGRLLCEIETINESIGNAPG